MEILTVILLLLATGHCLDGYLGCYKDAKKRLMPDYRMDLDGINTPGKCSYICSQLGYGFAGVENGIQCFCSFEEPLDCKMRADKHCQIPCPNSDQKCGGHWGLSVYAVGSLPDAVVSNYVGCYEDSNNRIFREFRIDLDEINSPTRCTYLCNALKFPYAGVESGNECFCSHKKPKKNKKKTDKECQKSCPYSKEKCGGSWHLAVYKSYVEPFERISISDKTVNNTYIGCFQDNEKRRLLAGYRIDLKDINSPKKCIYICRILDFDYAGVENGDECFCGNERPEIETKKSDKDCRSSCPHSKQKCGGSWRLSVYQASPP